MEDAYELLSQIQTELNELAPEFEMSKKKKIHNMCENAEEKIARALGRRMFRLFMIGKCSDSCDIIDELTKIFESVGEIKSKLMVYF